MILINPAAFSILADAAQLCLQQPEWLTEGNTSIPQSLTSVRQTLNGFKAM